MSNTVLHAFLSMKPRAHDAESVRIFTDAETRGKVIAQIEQWPCFALPAPHNAVAIGGLAVAGDTAEAWLITAEGFEKHLRVVLRQVKRLLADAVQVFGLRQLLVLVDPNRAGAVRFVQKLGFERFPRDAADGGRFALGQEKAVDMYFLTITKGVNNVRHC